MKLFLIFCVATAAVAGNSVDYQQVDNNSLQLPIAAMWWKSRLQCNRPDYALDNRSGSCYKFHTKPQKWADALIACAAEGGHLAVINSEEEAQVLKDLYEQHPPSSMPGDFDKHIAHIGFRYWSDRGVWTTIHGQSLKDAGYDKWALGQPDNHGGSQYCGGIFSNAKLDDLWCEGAYPFICEKKPDLVLSY